MKYKLLCCILYVTHLLWAAPKSNNYCDYVDPMIGTSAHGHTFPGAVVPFGMMKLSPDTGTQEWDWCSGYHYSDSSIMGFSHTHLSGTGKGGLGDILLMPYIGETKLEAGQKSNPDESYRSRFSHDREIAKPGFYQVYLQDYDIEVSLTAAKRSGMHKYVFPEPVSPKILLDLVHGVYNRQVLYSSIRVENDQLITGCKHVMGWSKMRQLYFAIEFSRPVKEFTVYKNGKSVGDALLEGGTNLKASFTFEQTKSPVVYVKIGLSSVSTAGAIQNLRAEIPGWDFNNVVRAAESAWNQELGVIDIDADLKTRTTFYTSLYHSMLFPEIHQDVDGQYRGLDQNIHQAKGFENYTIFSLWDTYRAYHPLVTILNPVLVNDFINSMLAHYDQNVYKVLPVWSIYHNEAWTMTGYHSVPVIVDAYFKGIRNYDVDKAWQAIKASAEWRDYDGLQYYMDMGYVPIDKDNEAASKTLEYALDDWGIAQMAKALGNETDYNAYIARSKNYENVFDAETGFFRAKLSDGQWREPFDPNYSEYRGDYTEGNAWQYNWFVPQEPYALIDLLGGKKRFVKKLDQFFSYEFVKGEVTPVDITGLIGQYAHGNEPSHHIAYLYNYAAQPWKTQERVHQILTTLYDESPEGLCGNEDCGQMSAWYVFSAMGFYPVNPVNSIYVFGSPVVDKAVLNLLDGNRFVVRAENLSDQNKYIQSVTLNGQKWNKSWIQHKNIMQGGELVFKMGKKPNKRWATDKKYLPPLAGY